MGLISYIKERYYNNRLKKADQLMNNNRSSEAEQIYVDLLDKQPFAATRLADYYFSLAKNADIKGTSDLFLKIIELEKKAENVYDVSSYNASLQEISKFIIQRAESLFKSASYEDCCTILEVLNDSRHKTEQTLDLYCESRINQILKAILKTKVSDSSFGTGLSTLRTEWSRGKRIKSVISVVKESVRELIKQNRFYAANELLAITGEKQQETMSLDNAVQIVNGKDSEAKSEEKKKTVSSFGKAIVLRNGISAEESVSIFESCWKASKDVNVIMDILKNAQPNTTKESLINRIVSNPRVFLEDKKLLDEFSLWLSKDHNPEIALKHLEKLNSLGYNMENLYVERLHGWIKSLANDFKIVHLDHAQMLFPNSTTVIEDKLECAKEYESQKYNDKAISVADSIVNKCNTAYVIKAKALYNKAELEKNVDEKESLLKNALKAINHIPGNSETLLKNKIKDSMVDVADQHYNEKHQDQAYKILDKLGKEGVKKAVLSILKHRESEIKAISNISDKLNESDKAIKEIDGYRIQDINQNPTYQAIWDIKIASALDVVKGTGNDDAVIELERISKEIESAGFDSSTVAAKKKNVLAEIIKRKYLIARDLEIAKKNEKAASLYKEINGLESKQNPTLSALRFIICKLKMQDNKDILEHKDMIYNLLRKAANVFSAEKEDIAYRFALILLKSGEDKEAIAVLNEFLPSETYLKKACEQGAMIKAQAKLEDFNYKIDAVKNKNLSSDDAVFFINHMLEYAEVIKPILDIPRGTLVKYRNKLKNYAIFKLFDEERYDVAFEKMLKEHTDYLDDLSALRNIALTCLNMAESKQMSARNYKEVIAVWLTAIYQEQLFVKSLDYTSWDDQYTFSLYGAYGHFNEDEYGDLPDNVNFYDFDDDNLVLIKEVQRSLLDRFEAAISEKQEYHNFYTSEKNAMDAFIALNLDEKCRFVAPYIAKNNEDIFDGITSALEHDREQEYDNWEDVLSVGAIYHMSVSIYTDYSIAKKYYEECLSAFDNFDTSKFEVARVSLIKKFRKLYSALVSSTNSRISTLKSSNKNEFKRNYTFYFAVCDCYKDKTLSFVFSNYIMSYVVGEVNGKKMNLSEASGYILSAYTLDTSNSRIKENLKTLFEMLCRESGTESSNAVNNILTCVKTRDVSFYSSLNTEYQDAKVTNELNSVVDNFKKKSISARTALEKVYTMYESNPNNEGVCICLAQFAQACIMEYIIGDSYQSASVKTTLSKIINNKSTEFRKQSSVFRTAYNDIWDRLPYDTQLLLTNDSVGSIIGQSLNDKGRALKSGLEYMKQLGGFIGNRSSLFNGLGGFGHK